MKHTTALPRLIDTARMQLPSALEGPIRLELFNVIKDFLQRTNAWQDEVQVDVAPNEYEYPLSANQNGAAVNRLIWLEGLRSDPSHPDTGTPRPAVLLRPGTGEETIRIQNPPNTNETWYAHVALCTSDPTDADGIPFVPEWVLEKYQLTLLEGLLERMMSTPAKPYSNLQGALYHGKRYRSKLVIARSEVSHKFTLGGNSWLFPQSFRSRSQRR